VPPADQPSIWKATMKTRFPAAGQCVPLAKLAGPVLADLRVWAAEFLPGHRDLPLFGAAFGATVVGPWATPHQLRLPARMVLWAYAFDDHLEQQVTGHDELDELVDRCVDVVRTGKPDTTGPLLTSLSAWQNELAQLPGYPPLAALWAEKFARCMRGNRYDWTVGRAREQRSTDETGVAPDVAPDVDEYLDHADSISLWLVNLPRWVAYGGDELVGHLDMLVPAVDDLSVAVRLANDLATIDRERDEPGQNNILMYDGVTPDGVRDLLTDRLTSIGRRLEPLLANDFLPAVGIARLTEWSMGVYDGTDLRAMTG
jgi:hypothetical protein